MNEIQTFVSILQSGGVIAILVILAVPSFKKKVFGNGDTKELKEIRDNHLHELKENQKEMKSMLHEIKNSLCEIQKYGVKIRKE
jgi:hypothetical protein